MIITIKTTIKIIMHPAHKYTNGEWGGLANLF